MSRILICRLFLVCIHHLQLQQLFPYVRNQSNIQFRIYLNTLRMDRMCKNNPDRFCYIYGNVVLSKSQVKITDSE